MSAGTKIRNSVISDGVSFMDRFEGVTLAAAEKLSCVLVVEGNNSSKFVAWYSSATAITLTNYNSFPTGSIIFDEQAHKTHERTSSGWVSSVARS